MTNSPRDYKTTKAVKQAKDRPGGNFRGGKLSGLNVFNQSRGGRKKVKVTLAGASGEELIKGDGNESR